MKLLMTLIILFASHGTFASSCKDDTKYPDVTTKKLETLVADRSVTIVDVNSEKSFKKNRVPGAIHYKTNKDKFAQVLPKDKNAMVIAYCGGKRCTAWKDAAYAACELGYTNVHHYSSGIKGWAKRKM